MAWTTSLPTRATAYDVLAADWNAVIGNLNFLAEIGYVEFTTAVSVTATTVGGANQVVSLGAITYLNAPVLIEFFSPRVSPGAAGLNLDLRDGTTVLGTLTAWPASANPGGSTIVRRRLTPTAGSHTYNVSAWNGSAATATINGGTGGSAGDSTTYFAGYLRATYIPT